VSVLFDLASLTPDYDSLVKKAGKLKRNCFASVFEKYFEFQEKGEAGHKQAIIHYREDETMYIEAKPDRVTVVFSTVFKDADDVVIGKVFMQEFREGRKASQTAPQVLYSHGEPPKELAATDARVGDNVAILRLFCSLAIQTKRCGTAPLTSFTYSEIICITTSNAAKFTFTLECVPKLSNSSKF